METKLFTKEKFSEVLKSFSFEETKVDFLYDVYETVIDGINDVAKSANHIDFAPVNNYVVILYILNEYKFLSSEFYQSENPLITSEDDFFDILAIFLFLFSFEYRVMLLLYTCTNTLSTYFSEFSENFFFFVFSTVDRKGESALQYLH